MKVCCTSLFNFHNISPYWTI